MNSGRFRRLADLGPPPLRQEIVSGLLAAGEIGLLTGAPGAGKSTLAASLSASVSRGMPWLDREVRAGHVVYLAAERAGAVQRRLLAASADPAFVSIADWAPQLATERDAIVGEISAVTPNPRLIVVDTVARLILGLDENSARDVGRAVSALTAISRAFPGAAMILIHHLAKGGGTARGSTALVAAVDVELRVGSGRGFSRLAVVKANSVPTGQELRFRVASLATADGSDEAVIEGEPTAPAEVLGAQAQRKSQEADAKAARLAQRLGDDPFTLTEAINAARGEGLLGSGLKAASERKSVQRMIDRAGLRGNLVEEWSYAAS